jgi:hypothetical protein
MKDQNPVIDNESKDVKWNRGLDLFIESVYRPDHELRQCSHNQKCHTELMEVREVVLEYLKTLRR